MTEKEMTWHFRVWLILVLLAIFTILLNNRFDLSVKLDTIAKDCTTYTIDLREEDVELDKTDG